MPPAHWIKGNELSRQPNRWVFVAVASRQVDDPLGVARVWDGAVTCCDSRETNETGWRAPRWASHMTNICFWEQVTGHARADARTVVMGWEMGELVRLADGLEVLPALGWRLERWQVGDRFTLLKWRCGKRSITLVDAVGCIPVGAKTVGALVPSDDPPADWSPDGAPFQPDKTTTTVGQLRHAMLDLLDWETGEDLGNWQPTSGSQAWANWRHRHYTHTILVHDDDAARRAEREAAWAGRCEAWRWGRLADERWSEWDLPLAYPNVCLTANLPTVLRGRVRKPPSYAIVGPFDNERWLIKADVLTESEVLPSRREGGLLWPVGHVTGWYWDVELAEAYRAGASIELLDSYRYSAGMALREWAEWVIEYVNSAEPVSTELRRAVVKGWGRSLIGRFATRYWQWEDWGATKVDGIRMDRLANRETGTEGRWLHVGGRSMVALDMVDGLETAPALMSAVMAECRVRLWRIIQAAGPANVAYCDTDSVLVNERGSEQLAELVAGGGGWGLRRKGSWRDLEVLGPRQVIAADRARLSGVPLSARRVAATVFAGSVTEGLEQAIISGDQAKVVVRPRVWRLNGTDRRRVHLPGGLTGPVRV